MKKLVIACVLLAFTSCMKEGKPVVVKDSVSNYKVEKLFEVDGISVYRFLDGNKRVYFTNKQGTFIHGESKIKTCIKHRQFVNDLSS